MAGRSDESSEGPAGQGRTGRGGACGSSLGRRWSPRRGWAGRDILVGSLVAPIVAGGRARSILTVGSSLRYVNSFSAEWAGWVAGTVLDART